MMTSPLCRVQDATWRSNGALAPRLQRLSIRFACGRPAPVDGDQNPARAIEKYREESRERFLSSDELERLGAAISDAETAALISALTFAVGAALPLLMVLITPAEWLIGSVGIASLAFLGILGAVGARAGGADPWRPTVRVLFWGALAMAITAGIGAIFGIVA